MQYDIYNNLYHVLLFSGQGSWQILWLTDLTGMFMPIESLEKLNG